MSNYDLWINSSNNMSSLLEHVTPYKICVVVLIQEYCLIKTRADKTLKNNLRRALFVASSTITPACKRDFCMLALLLTQSPDMDHCKLIELLDSEKYQLQPELVENFKKQLKKIANEDVGCVIDIFSNIERLIGGSSFDESLIGRTSKIGLYLRRVSLHFMKLSFDQTVEVYVRLQNYIDGKKTNTPTSNNESIDEKMTYTQPSMELDFSSIPGDQSSVFSLSDSVAAERKEIKICGDSGLWSKNQVELFVSEQSRLLIEDSSKALPPHQLQAKIKQVLATSSDHAEAHYLSYLNNVRSKELNGAIDSLYHFFDRKTYSSQEEDKSKNLRLAALNLGILHVLFNKKKEAICALNEAVTLAHEANDNFCLQYAQTWLHKLKCEKRETVIQKSLHKSQELNMNYLLSYGYQAFAQQAAFSQQTPATVFELLSRSESLACQYQMVDLLAISFVQRAALWSLYGRPDLASLCCQQLLNLASSDTAIASSQSTIIAVAVLIHQFALKGEYEDGWKVVEFSKNLSKESEWLVWCEAQLYFMESLHKGQWQQAKAAVNQLALVDNTESLLRLCEVMLAKGDRRSAYNAANAVLEMSESPLSRTRALRLIAKSNRDSAFMYLARALHIASSFYLDYYKHLITFDMVRIQVEMNIGSQASRLAESSLLGILSHGSFSDMTDCLLLYAKSKIVAELPAQSLASVVKLLDNAQHYAKRIHDYARVKNIAYLQALLCDKLGMTTHRNKYAYQFRTLDQQFPSYNASLLRTQVGL